MAVFRTAQSTSGSLVGSAQEQLSLQVSASFFNKKRGFPNLPPFSNFCYAYQ